MLIVDRMAADVEGEASGNLPFRAERSRPLPRRNPRSTNALYTTKGVAAAANEAKTNRRSMAGVGAR